MHVLITAMFAKKYSCEIQSMKKNSANQLPCISFLKYYFYNEYYILHIFAF